jgi:hypothetical protein
LKGGRREVHISAGVFVGEQPTSDIELNQANANHGSEKTGQTKSEKAG